MTKKHLTDQRFTELKLIDSLKKGIAEAGFEYCTPIQEKSLPSALAGEDVAGQAQTGTGKTVAFLLACCQHLINHPAPENRKKTNVRALILAPTRELAIQIHNDAEVLAKHTDLKLGLVYGGTGYDDQKKMLSKGVDILIGTPGRLIDYYKQKLFDLKLVQVVVLDEADRMFDLGFIKDIRFLLRRMPKPEDRLNLLFSATLSFRVMELAYEHMSNPKEIKIDAETPIAEKIQEYSFYPANEEKSTLLVNLLHRDKPERVLVFVNTRHVADQVSRTLTANNISNAAISGDVPQRKRESILNQFKAGKCTVLVATDVAARGLHIPEVSQVYNFDLPQDADDYVHRIGRTARAGHSGEAISFICEKYAYSIMEIESYIGHPIPKREIDTELLSPIEIATKQHRKNNNAKSSASKKSQPQKSNTKSPNKSRPVKKKVNGPQFESAETHSNIEDATDQNHIIESESAPNQTDIKQHEATDSTESANDSNKSASPLSAVTAKSGSSRRSQVKNSTRSMPSTPKPDVKPEAALKTKTENLEDFAQAPEQAPNPIEVPKNRFSRRFGEVPLIG